MPKRLDLDTIIIIGAGPIIIGQACEFDYSGTQALKALKSEGYRVVLLNSNPATIMTDPELADATYIEPVTPAYAKKMLERERRFEPDANIALLPTMGGQTALNTALSLERDGTLKELNIELIGAKADVIERAEDRDLFRKAMGEIGLECPTAMMIYNLEDAEKALVEIGLPAIFRPSFTLGGTGGGIAYNEQEFRQLAQYGLRESPASSVLVEESVLGWKEFEMEVVRDHNDNCIIVCSIENIDPMGTHTGDSITIAPALTLSDREYQRMRNASIAILRKIGVDTGGSNVQFAVNPDDGRIVVIEMNPRVSRSSALASKATGFPIAKVAARLAVGYTLNELSNDITGTTPASFEPSIDYIVTKIPRFAFEKFPNASNLLSTSMKSVGEAMGIGRNFCESFQKTLRCLETDWDGLNEPDQKTNESDDVMAHIAQQKPERILWIAKALREGYSIETIYQACKIDRWFLRQFDSIIKAEQSIIKNGLFAPHHDHEEAKALHLQHLKAMGFADSRLATLSKLDKTKIAELRARYNVQPVYKRIDSCAGEFESRTNYFYGTYALNGFTPSECESNPSERSKIAILGSGPNRIGQGIEFDYCCVHAAYALKAAGYETIMINCNPETVSTDYDTADRLYFEPLCDEDVIAVLQNEQKKGQLKGVIVQFGGQTPLKLSHALQQANIPILGTSSDSIDLAEDRERFQKLLHKIGLTQPKNAIASSRVEAIEKASTLGYPIVIRPSYVLGGRAMEIVRHEQALKDYIDRAVKVSGRNPVLIDQYLQNAYEVDVDAICDGTDVFIAGIMEHIEEAGIHSGDSACSLPPYRLEPEILPEISKQTKKIALALNVVGLLNVQFAIKDQQIYVLEANPRASRTVPFVAKATNQPIAKIAARIMAGEVLSNFDLKNQIDHPPKHTAIKEAVFPFTRFAGSDVMLGPEMRSTGEVMGLSDQFALSYLKAQNAANNHIPLTGTVFVSVKDDDKALMVEPLKKLASNGLKIIATHGTADFLRANHITCESINKVYQGYYHCVNALLDNKIQMVFNTVEGQKAIQDSRSLRQTALHRAIPYFTTLSAICAICDAICAVAQHK
ncbi:MAG: carbamoyl-phosphate synthase large subunit, partial [Pseudomonadota bacterium]